MANEHIGARQEIAFKIESVRGTAVDPVSGDWFPHTGIGFIPVPEKIEDNSGMGHIASRSTQDIAKEYSQGSVSMRLYDTFLTPLNTMIFGAAGNTVGAATTYTLANNNIHSSFTITCSDPVSGDTQYKMGMLNTCTISANTDDYVTLGMEFIAGKEGTATVTPGYTTTALPYTPDEITIGYAANFAGLSSPTSLVAKNININIEKACEIDWGVGSTEPTDIYNQRFDVSGDFTVTYDATTMKTLALADTVKSMIITLSNGAWKWEIKIPAVQFSDWNRSSDLGAYVTQTFGFKAEHSDATNGFIQAVVTDL